MSPAGGPPSGQWTTVRPPCVLQVMHPNGEELVYQPAEIFYQAPAEPLH